jgi:hypothetical protein
MCYVIFFLERKIRGLYSCLVVGGVPLLEEWPLSFDVVATCPGMRGSVDDVATTRRAMIIPMATCLSFGFDLLRGLRPHRHESWCDLALFEGIVA